MSYDVFAHLVLHQLLPLDIQSTVKVVVAVEEAGVAVAIAAAIVAAVVVVAPSTDTVPRARRMS